MMKHFTQVADVSEIPRGKGRLVYKDGISVVVFNAWGAFYGVEDGCTVCGSSLADAEVKGSMVFCPVDRAAFYLPVGTYLGPEELKPLRPLQVRVDGDEIKINTEEMAVEGLHSPSLRLVRDGESLRNRGLKSADLVSGLFVKI